MVPDPRGDLSPEPGGAPAGGAYEWFHRGLELLQAGDAAAAATLLARAAGAEPESASVLEALGRAQYGSGAFADAVVTFTRLIERAPDGDYAHFGLGLSLARTGRFDEALRHLRLATAMRPDRDEYAEGLRQVDATLRARRDGA